MEKEMLVHLKLKEGKLETFMGWMQSDEGMSVRKSVAYPEKTIGAMIPDKSTVMFKIFCTDEAALYKFIEGTEVSKPIMSAVLDSYSVYHLTKAK